MGAKGHALAASDRSGELAGLSHVIAGQNAGRTQATIQARSMHRDCRTCSPPSRIGPRLATTEHSPRNPRPRGQGGCRMRRLTWVVGDRQAHVPVIITRQHRQRLRRGVRVAGYGIAHSLVFIAA